MRQVFPSGVDFIPPRDFAVLADGSHVLRKFAQQGVPVVPDGLPKQLVWVHGPMKKGVADFLMHSSIYIASENIRRLACRFQFGLEAICVILRSHDDGGSRARRSSAVMRDSTPLRTSASA